MEKIFVKATDNYSTLEEFVAAPYMRRSFELDFVPDKAELSICGLGFYVLFINGMEITKGHLAPYISNPDHYCYYDKYDIKEYLVCGKNTVGIILGNGFMNSVGGYTWDFDKAPWRGAPCVAFELNLAADGHEAVKIIADENVKTHPSPIYFDDIRYGEYYDAQREAVGWCLPEFDDSKWTAAIHAEAPRGELRLCKAEPIKTERALKVQNIAKCEKGYIFDFGINSAGVCRLNLKNGVKGQKLTLRYAERVKDGELWLYGTVFEGRFPHYYDNNQKDIYICCGGESETWKPRFTYHGFRYVLVEGLDESQVSEDLLIYEVMHSDLKKHGDFKCSDERVNTLFGMVQNSDMSNFYYFPTDCPHREKNGWTGDAALSCFHMMLLYGCEHSFEQWLACIRKAQDAQGALPGIVPTDTWGYEWGNGPGWDSVAFYLPYECWRLRGNTQIIKDNAHMMVRYLEYVMTRRNADGTISIGLGDWASVGRRYSKFLTPLEVSDSIIVMDMARKASEMFDAVGYTHQAVFAKSIYEDMRKTVRRELLDKESCSLKGRTQTAQSMGLYHGIFEEDECKKAFDVLLELLRESNDSIDCGIYGLLTMFHVLSQYGEGELALKMITKDEYPSYGNLILRGETALPERFMPDGAPYDSHNHHFFGDIARWFIREIAGLDVKSSTEVLIKPSFIGDITSAEAYYELPAGRVAVAWSTDMNGRVSLEYSCPEGVDCVVNVPETVKLKRRSL